MKTVMNMRRNKKEPSLVFNLMGAAAMRPCGPGFNNLTDIRTAPAGSPNHRHGFEQNRCDIMASGFAAHKYRQRRRKSLHWRR